jgi:hypothetical protein
MKKTLFGIFIVATFLMFCGGCKKVVNEAMQEQARQTNKLTEEAQRQVGMPNLTNFTELRLLNKLYELRDTEGLQTYTYIRDYNGNMHHLCNSIGYGMPFSAQRTTPEQPTVLEPYGSGMSKAVYVLPQPEPNGIYPPTTSSATWIICSDSEGKFNPVYEESEISVSPFPLKAVDSYTQDEPPSWK